MKIGILSDIHHGPPSHAKNADWDALAALDTAVTRLNEAGADLLLDLGDRISDTTREADLVYAAEIAASLSRFSGPRYHLIGNHDVGNLTPDDNARLLGQTAANQLVDLGALRLILWQPDVKLDVSRKPLAFPHAVASLRWLIEALEGDSRPAIIATHIPVSGHPQTGNFYFENNAGLNTYPDHAPIRQAVEATGKAAMWLSGHVHWNTLINVRNLPHITIQSFSERFTTFPETACAFAVLEIVDGTFTLEVFGNDPWLVRLPFRPSGAQRWLPPIPPLDAFEDMAGIQNELAAHVAALRRDHGP